jgi:hypothetical protein
MCGGKTKVMRDGRVSGRGRDGERRGREGEEGLYFFFNSRDYARKGTFQFFEKGIFTLIEEVRKILFF